MIMTMLMRMATMPMMTMTMMGKCRWHRGKGWNNSATRNLGQGRTQPAAAGAGNMWSSGSPSSLESSSLTLRFCAKVSWATKWWQNNHLKIFLSDCHMRLRRGAISCHISVARFEVDSAGPTFLHIFRHWTRCKRWLPCVTQYFALYFPFSSIANLESHSLYSLSFSPQTMMVSAIYIRTG